MKKLLNILPVILIICMILTNIFAADINKVDDILNTNGKPGIDKVNDTARNIWATIATVVQVLSVSAVVFAGLRYMFASADTKADIKKSLGILALGAILVFASTTIIQFIVRATKEAAGEG